MDLVNLVAKASRVMVCSCSVGMVLVSGIAGASGGGALEAAGELENGLPTRRYVLSEEEEPGVLLLERAPEVPRPVWNGTVVGSSEFRRVGALVASYSSGGYWYGGNFCSATVIHDRWVVTAAHCVEAIDEEYQGYEIYVVFDNDAYELSTAVKAIDWFAHPSYNARNISNDVGLIELVADSPVGAQAVNASNPDPWRGDKLTYVGYGITSDDAEDGGVKRKTEITFQGCQEPGSWYGGCETDQDQILYAYSGDTNVCQGDSGGAVFKPMGNGSYRLVGVNSFVSPGCVNGGTGAARIDVFLPWIEQYVPSLLLEGESTDGPPDEGDAGGSVPTPEDPGDEDGLDVDEPPRPADDEYATSGLKSCSVAPVSGGAAGWMLGVIALAMVSRRRVGAFE